MFRETNSCISSGINLCLSHHKIRRTETIPSCTKNGVFFTAGSREKDTIFGAARTIFGPSYFVTALVVLAILSNTCYLSSIHLNQTGAMKKKLKFGTT